jgi:hypothetical protein
MRRREFIGLLSGAASLCTRRSIAQPSERVRVVRWLANVPPDMRPVASYTGAQTMHSTLTNALRVVDS